MTAREVAGARVYGRDGLLGTVVQSESTSVGATAQTLLVLSDGTQLFIPSTVLVRRDDGSYDLPYSLAELRQANRPTDGQQVVIPIIAEELAVDKRVVETGRVRVQKLIREHIEEVDVPVTREELDIERIEINQLVEQAPAVRHENDVLVVPVVEEVLVVEKRLMLREELRITKRRTTSSTPQQVTLRREELVVERLDPEHDASASSPKSQA